MDMSFKPTNPQKLDLLPPKKSIKNSDFSELLLSARVELAELKGSCGQIPNPLLVSAPLLIRESVESSGIENINTTVGNVLESQLLPIDQQTGADKEVLHYREALFWGSKNLEALSLSNRLILNIQKKLMPELGGYRTTQNAIGNSMTKEILYTPPVQAEIPELIANWQKYVNQNKDVDPLIRAAIAHYQFEAIHPFDDGNGRTGRILMVLQLVNDGILEYPILFISGYINENKSEYYRLLREVTMSDNWQEYIEFMLKAFHLQAKETKETIGKITKLHRELKAKIKNDHSKIYTADLLESLFTYPVITPTKLAAELGIHYTTASKHLSQLAEAEILQSMKVGRNHLFINKKLVAVLTK